MMGKYFLSFFFFSASVLSMYYHFSFVNNEVQIGFDIDDTSVQKYIPYWDRIPSNFKSFPDKDNVSVVDPWNYLHRMGLYRSLLNMTEPLMASFGTENTGNVLWGLVLQHGWQMSSGRLWLGASDHHRGDVLISPCSWWAVMNYYLSVIPFIGAGQAGYYHQDIHFKTPDFSRCQEFSAISMKNIVDARLNAHYSLCPDEECLVLEDQAVKLWKHFFLQLKEKYKTMTQDDALEVMWEAHVASINAGRVASMAFLPFMSRREANFGESWARLVGFIAETRFPTTFDKTRYLQAMYLPSRILSEDDQPLHISDMSLYKNRALACLEYLSLLEEWIGGGLEKVWARAMCSRSGREMGRETMETLLVKPFTGLITLSKLSMKILWKTCD